MLLKVDTSGNILWKDYFAKDSILISGITEVENSYYIVFQNYFSNSNEIDWIKVSPNGNLASSDKWITPGGSGYHKIIKADNNYLTIVSTYLDATDSYLLLFKSDTSGNVSWNKTYLTDGLALPKIIETTDSGFAIVARKIGCLAVFNISLIKTNNQGDTLWTKIYGGVSSENHPGSIIQTIDNGYTIPGSYDGSGLYLIKTDANGNSGCDDFCPGIAIGNTIITQAPGNHSIYNDTIFSTPLSWTSYTGIYEGIICFSVGVNEIKNEEGNIKVYPNPASAIITVTSNRKEYITITNLFGEVVMEKKSLTDVQGKTELDVSLLSAGIYFVKAGNKVGKFVKD